MRKKRLMLISLGIVASTTMGSVVISCSTSWNKWNPKDSGDSKYKPEKYVAGPKLWEVRKNFETVILPTLWTPATNTLNITKINNQFELYLAIGYITQIKQDGMSSIDSYYAMGSATPKDDQWKGLKNYINNLNDSTTINIEENATSYGSVTIDLSSNKQTLLSGFKNYVNSDIDTNKPAAKAPFHNQRKYDVEYRGLNSSGQPVDFSQVAQAGISLTSISTVSALLAIDGTFALQLSKLVNIPKDAFTGFTDFMTSMDKFFNSFMNNEGYKKWIVDNDINMNIVINSNGIINQTPPPFSTSFKGGIIVEMLK